MRIIPTDARDELRALAYGLTTKEYTDKVWAMRIKEAPAANRVKSKSWPKTIRTKAGYVLPVRKDNVLALRKKKP